MSFVRVRPKRRKRSEAALRRDDRIEGTQVSQIAQQQPAFTLVANTPQQDILETVDLDVRIGCMPMEQSPNEVRLLVRDTRSAHLNMRMAHRQLRRYGQGMQDLMHLRNVRKDDLHWR